LSFPWVGLNLVGVSSVSFWSGGGTTSNLERLFLCLTSEGVETSSHPRGGVWFPAASRLLGGGGCYW